MTESLIPFRGLTSACTRLLTGRSWGLYLYVRQEILVSSSFSGTPNPGYDMKLHEQLNASTLMKAHTSWKSLTICILIPGELDINACAVPMVRDIPYPWHYCIHTNSPNAQNSLATIEQACEGLVKESITLVTKGLNGYLNVHPLSTCDSNHSHTL